MNTYEALDTYIGLYKPLKNIFTLSVQIFSGHPVVSTNTIYIQN